MAEVFGHVEGVTFPVAIANDLILSSLPYDFPCVEVQFRCRYTGTSMDETTEILKKVASAIRKAISYKMPEFEDDEA